MQRLIEMIGAINVEKLKASGLWHSILEPGSLMEKLYNGIAEGKVKSNADAAALVYPGQKAGAKLSNLCDRLKERLQSVMFLLDFHASLHNSDRQKAYFECHRKWSVGMALMTKNIRLAGIEQLEWVYKQSVHYEFTDLILSTLSILRLHYGTVQNNPELFHKYRDDYNAYLEVYIMENKAEDLYAQLISQYAEGKMTDGDFIALATDYFQQIEPFLAVSASFKLHLSARLMQLMLYTNSGNYEKTIEVCESAIQYFQSKPFTSYLPLQAFSYQMMISYLKLAAFDKGRDVVINYQGFFEYKSFNWYKLQDIYFLLAMHTRHYEEAAQICDEMEAVLKTDTQPESTIETWRIYRAYIVFLTQIGLVPSDDVKSLNFRVTKFLNETPLYAKDKQGMNVPIVIIHILFSIQNPRLYHALDHTEAIEKYCNRYLKKDDLLRSNYFIKALLQVPTSSIVQDSACKKVMKWLEMLESLPDSKSNHRFELEIIPYEHLWEILVRSLQAPVQRQLLSVTLKHAA